MLVICSDLHFQHVGMDGVRVLDGGRVREFGVRRNVSAGAFERLFRMIDQRARRVGADEVVLVFAGDVFELRRSPLWFLDRYAGVDFTTPDPGPDTEDNSLRDCVHRILDGITADCADVWPVLAKFVREGKYRYLNTPQRLRDGTSVAVRFLPGNHDRLANAWPSMRRRIRDLLSMTPGGTPFDYELIHESSPDAADYRVLVRHGHAYDSFEFDGPTQRGASLAAPMADQLRPCFGDYVTIQVAARMCSALRAIHGGILRNPGPEGERLRRLYARLTEFDDVRPPGLLVRFLAEHAGADAERVFRYLRPIMRDVVEAAQDDAFVAREADRLGFGGLVSGPGALALREALKNLGPDTLRSVLDRIVGDNWKESAPGDPSGPADAARYEPAWRERRVDLVVTGHTHLAEQVPLGSTRTGGDGFYLNTGTWRTTIPSGVDDVFARLRTYSMVFCFSDRERGAQRGDGRTFESWSGHLSASEGSGGYGPYEEDVGPALAPTHELSFTRLVVHHVDEGDGFLGSAELRLRFGVDDEMRMLNRDGVRDGDRIDLTYLPEVLLTPSLDGELWFHGVEKDHGDSIFDMDDPLPWAIDRLPRASSGQDAEFQSGDGLLSIRGRAGTRIELEYVVRSI